MISCTYEAEIIIWDAETYIVLKILQECHSDSIRGLTFHPNGKKFISSSDDKTLKLWDL
jgi:platelet-activating factor acetylhydrolase IB subunit alpha